MCHFNTDGYFYYRMLSVRVGRGCANAHFASGTVKIGIIFFALLQLVYAGCLRVFQCIAFVRTSLYRLFLGHAFCSVFALVCVHFVSFYL